MQNMIEANQQPKPKRRGERKPLALARPQLTQKALDSNYDVVLIMAPIGYGKKTLMSQLEGALPQPIVIKLDVDDSNPFTLISHIRAELEGVIDFDAPAFDPSVATVNHLIATIEALDKTEQDLQFFFHGSQVLNNSSAQLLERFMVKLPAGHRVFISGFNTSNLSLSEVYISARVLTLEGHDLLLSLKETTSMLNVMQSDLDAQTVFEKSGGVVSLVFVMANTNSLEAVSFEKFIENALNEIPEDMLDFLEKMSVFEIWNDETIAALELEAPKDWVEKVLSYGLPISVSNNKDLQPHGVLLSLLFENLRLNNENFKLINSKAAQWHISKDLNIKSIKHLIFADEIEIAENYAIKEFDKCLFKTGDYGNLRQIINLFALKYVNIKLELIKIFILMQSGLLKNSIQEIKKVSKSISESNESYKDFIIIKIVYFRHVNNLKKAIELSEKYIHLFFESNNKTFWLYKNIASCAIQTKNLLKLSETIENWSKIANSDNMALIHMKMFLSVLEHNDRKIKHYGKFLYDISISRNADYEAASLNYLSLYSAFNNNFEEAKIKSDFCYSISSFNRPFNSINNLGTTIDILIMFEKFEQAYENIRKALKKGREFDITTTTFKLQEFDLQLHSGNLGLIEYEFRVDELPIFDITDQLTVEFHKARIAFIQKNYTKAISFALNAIKDDWIPTRVRAWAYLVAAYYQLGSNKLTEALQMFNRQLSVFGTLRAFTLDWQYLESTFEALRDEGLLVEVKWTHGSSGQVKPKLEIVTLGRYRVVLNDEILDLPDDATELLAYLALHSEKSIEEMLNDFAGLDSSLIERAKLKKRLEYRFTVLREKFWACCPDLVANKNGFFAFDKKTGKYGFGNLFSLRFDAKHCQVLHNENLIDFYKGTFLPKSESVWAVALADQLEQRFMRAAHEHVTTLEAKEAIGVYEKILQFNETDEIAWTGLIQSYVSDGQEQQAKWTFKRWQKVALEFGFDPPNFQFPNALPQ